MDIQQWDPVHRQLVWLAGGVMLGGAAGFVAPGVGDSLSPATWPLLTAVLFATFLQVQVRALPEAFESRRFLPVAIAGNFLVIPALVGLAVAVFPLDDAVRVGILLVLLAPCTDWFVSFTHLGRGDARLAAALTPILLLSQFVMVPVCLWALTGLTLSPDQAWPVLFAFLFVVVLPLLAALLIQRKWADSARIEQAAGQAVVPLLAATLFVIAASEARTVVDASGDIGAALAIFAAFAVAAGVLAKVLAPLGGLSRLEGRTLAFNFGSRNSFVVLPLALTLPADYALAAPVVAAQSLVELVALLAYVRVVPGWLFPGEP